MMNQERPLPCKNVPLLGSQMAQAPTESRIFLQVFRRKLIRALQVTYYLKYIFVYVIV